jgi:hypothetical protein
MADDAMIAFLPVDGSWCKQDFPHMTLVHAGPIADRNEEEFNRLAKDALSAGRLTGVFNLCVTGVEELGTDQPVDALIVYPTPQLLQARKMVADWDTGEFPDYKPHLTIGPAGSATLMTQNPSGYSLGYMNQSLPTKVYFNRIAACWGDKRLIFNIDAMY